MKLEQLDDEDRRSYLRLRELVDGWARLGQREYPDGTRWIGHTPHRAPEAYMHQLFAPLDSKSIEELQDLVDYDFPKSFADFLQLHNGIGLFSDSITIDGLRKNWSRSNIIEAAQQPYSMTDHNVDRRPRGAPDELLFVGSLGDDRQLVAMLPGGQLVKWDSETQETTGRLYSNVFKFLLVEAERAQGLFDETGRRMT